MPEEPSIHATIELICAAFGGDDPTLACEISREQVLDWMHSRDIQVQGCVLAMICDFDRAKHITPQLGFEDYYGFVVPHLIRCIEENPDSQWVHSRYIAGYDLVKWITTFWKDETVPRAILVEIKQRLADLYKSGDEGVRDAVLNAVLEHLFENGQLADFFKDWQDDPVLAHVYQDALLWRQEMPPGVGRLFRSE